MSSAARQVKAIRPFVALPRVVSASHVHRLPGRAVVDVDHPEIRQYPRTRIRYEVWGIGYIPKPLRSGEHSSYWIWSITYLSPLTLILIRGKGVHTSCMIHCILLWKKTNSHRNQRCSISSSSWKKYPHQSLLTRNFCRAVPAIASRVVILGPGVPIDATLPLLVFFVFLMLFFFLRRLSPRAFFWRSTLPMPSRLSRRGAVKDHRLFDAIFVRWSSIVRVGVGVWLEQGS